jgi:hypothetical protein
MRYLFILLCSLSLLQANAQNKTANSDSYKSGIGIRVWDGAGFSLKTFFAENQAIDLTAFFSKNTRIVGLYQKHGDLSTEGNFKWYAGVGGSVVFVNSASVVGLNGVIGLDYKLRKMPINASFDWQPVLQFKNGDKYDNWFSLAVRYTF